jgi:hypothetical protein
MPFAGSDIRLTLDAPQRNVASMDACRCTRVGSRAQHVQRDGDRLHRRRHAPWHIPGLPWNGCQPRMIEWLARNSAIARATGWGRWTWRRWPAPAIRDSST